jgi:hypothetical protein
MHCVVTLDNILVNIRNNLMPPNPPHDDHLCAKIVEVSPKNTQKTHDHAQKFDANFDAT